MDGGAIGRSAVIALAAGLSAAPARSAPPPDGPYRAMIDRPLFSPTRRPPPPPPEPADAGAPPPLPPPPPPDVALSGIIAGGGGGVALLKRPLDPAPVRVARGGTIDGWTVAEIRPRSVVLRRDARSVTVDLPTASR